MNERGTWFFYLTSCEAVPFLFAFMIIVVTCIVISRRGGKFLRSHEHAVLQVASSSKDEPTNASSSQATDAPSLQGHEQHGEDIMKKEA